MAISAKSDLTQLARPAARTVTGCNGRPDAIEREFLGLWLGISRLREQVLGDYFPQSGRARARVGRPRAGRKSRGHAA